MQLLETAYPTGVHCDLDNLYDINNPFPIHAATIKLFRNGAWVTAASLGKPTGPNDPPNAAFNYSVNNLTANFDASPSTPGTDPIASYAWTFDDGATDVGLTVSHDYASAGAKTVTLTVTDTANRSSSRTQTVTVVDVSTPPVADFSSTVTGLSVAFSSALSKGGSGTITDYSWNFGDGGTSTAANPTYAYPQSNTYTVTLTVTNDLGATDSGTHTVTVAANTAGYEYFGTATPVNAAVSLNPAGAAVTQALVHHNDTNEYWVTQVTPSGDSTYPDHTRISRMNSSGALLGQMVLDRAGHGLTLAVDYQGVDPFVWVSWDSPAAGSTREFDIVRFPWSDTGNTVQARDSIGNLDVMIPGNGGKRALSIDWEAQRACLTTFGTCQLLNMSDILARGTLYPVKTVNTPYGSGNTWQGFCTYNDSVFQLFGAPKSDGDDPTVDPWIIREYSWQTGQLIKTLSLSNVEKTGATTWTAGHVEPEGLCVYDPGVAGTNPQMQFSVVTGPSGSHAWHIWNVDVKTQFEAAGARVSSSARRSPPRRMWARESSAR
jgi:PKD repeat protein